MGSHLQNKTELKNQGLFIAIEGTDGSGKATQVAKLKGRLEGAGYTVEVIDFPQYKQESSYFVRKYLNGDYGSAEAIGPFTPSLFYALDRFDAGRKIREALSSNKIVIADRFVGSNLAHQGQKFEDQQQKLAYWDWDQKLEFEMLATPRPKLNLILTLPPEVSLKLMENRAGEKDSSRASKDIHEADPEHLKRSLNAYIELSEFAPQEFVRIECARGGELMPIDEISNLIWNKIEPILPEPSTLSLKPSEDSYVPLTPENLQYHHPNGLDDSAKQLYQKSMDKILAIHQQLSRELSLALNQKGEDDAEKLAAEALSNILPIGMKAWFDKFNISQNDHGGQSALSHLNLKSAQREPDDKSLNLSLVNFTPRNELDALPALIYPYTDLSLAELKAELSTQPYQTKLRAFNYLLGLRENCGSRSDLGIVVYHFDVTSSANVFVAFKASGTLSLGSQALGPYGGFSMPQAIKEAGLESAFAEAFQISSKLYLSLSERGFENQAQYAVLMGNKMRWQARLSLNQLIKLKGDNDLNPEAKTLLAQMLSLISEVHPNIAALVDGNL